MAGRASEIPRGMFSVRRSTRLLRHHGTPTASSITRLGVICRRHLDAGCPRGPVVRSTRPSGVWVNAPLKPGVFARNFLSTYETGGCVPLTAAPVHGRVPCGFLNARELEGSRICISRNFRFLTQRSSSVYTLPVSRPFRHHWPTYWRRRHGRRCVAWRSWSPAASYCFG